LNVTDDEIISRVSIKQLAPNQSQNVSFLYPISSVLQAGNYFVGLEIDPFNEIQENDESNLFCVSNTTNCITFNITNSVQHYQKYTYPIIFVHGWTGNEETWNDFTDESDLFYGWTYGGRLSYCLNPDDDQYTSDGFYYSFVNTNNLVMGDYYYVNFDISTNGVLHVGNDGFPLNDDYSNQSAIVKQGWALHDAIENVLAISGASKVILVGHSMGGLASREYIQNPSNWQQDGEHHVAKLLTIATPNGGSNFSLDNIDQLGWVFGYDLGSEAVRDLRFPSIEYGGKYLFGGTETVDTDFYNNDVNCNGSLGDDITGLNEKPNPADINYSCIISPNDGIVELSRADLNNYLLATPPFATPYADKFTVNSNHLNIHKENHSTLIRGLDEPFLYDLAYTVPINSLNYGFTTEQAPNNPLSSPNNTVDWDDYKFTVPSSGSLEIGVWNIPVHGCGVYLLDASYNVIQEVQATGESNVFFTGQLSAGEYYLEVGTIPTANSWRFPYGYSIIFTPTSGLTADFQSNSQQGCTPLSVQFSNQSVGNPTSYSWSFPGGTPSSSTQQNPTISYNSAGTFPVTFTVNNSQGNSTITKNGYITVTAKPTAEFDYQVEANNSIKFLNQTNNTGLAQTYTWTFGDNISSAEFSPLHTYASSGTYSVKLVAQNSCGNTSKTRNVMVTLVGTENQDLDGSVISIFPNPNNGMFTVKIKSSTQGTHEIKIINSIGQTIKCDKIIKTNEEYISEYDLQNLPSGLYILQVISEKGQKSLKIQINR
jgi:PKD repeat protein/pimeloyl-ACP methyl ester carboxylesterase